jgi:heptosyltransferase-2
MKKVAATAELRPRRILVRGVNWLGDAIMSTPALQRLREQFPEAHITLLCPAKLSDLWHYHPALSKVISFGPTDSVFTTAEQLRKGCFDLALILPNSPRSALECYLARIPHRIGHARGWRNYFLTRTIPSRPGSVPMRKRSTNEIKKLTANWDGRPKPAEIPATAHQMHEYLHLVNALGASEEPLPPHLAITEQEMVNIRVKFKLPDLDLPIFGINPGAEYGPAKRWPADKFAAVIRRLQEQTHGVWLLFGGPNDQALTRQITDAVGVSAQPIHDLAGQTTLRELMALLKICRVVLTNDTGPMHVAAAVGTPVVVPFGSTSPELTGPVESIHSRHQLLKSNVPCSPCFLRECPIDFRCMNGLSVERISAAFLAATNPKLD